MQYNPNIHHRKSIRLKGYDYSQVGLYFITICTQNRECLFGDIKNGDIILNDAGEMVKHWYYELNNKFNDIKCHTMVVMPNHFHCIIENVGTNVGADLRVCPIDADALRVCPNDCPNNTDEHVGAIVHDNSMRDNILGEHTGSPLRDVVRWFKTMTTNYYIRGVKQNDWAPFERKLWQRNYWEHIIRTPDEYQNITQYIINNPQQWENDKLK